MTSILLFFKLLDCRKHVWYNDHTEFCMICARVNCRLNPTAARVEPRNLLDLHLIRPFFAAFTPMIVLICAGDFATHLGRAVVETHLVADLLPEDAAHLLGYPLGHRSSSQAARHGDADLPIATKTWTEDAASSCTLLAPLDTTFE